MPTDNLFLRTNLQWEDLVLPAATAHQVQEIITWINTSPSMKEQMTKQTSSGYKALFYGEDDKTQTLTAALIGKAVGTEVIQLQLADFVAENEVETEKNFASIFEIAKQRNYILFLEHAATPADEIEVSDVLFNQLIQHLVDFPGLVIITSNTKANTPKALAENLQLAINFG